MDTHQYARIDKSRIWKDIIKYFKNNGINAFNSVPYMITSSENLAHAYAKIIQTTIPTTQLQVIELGAGHGQFGYRLNRILQPKKYHLTDCSEPLQDFWLNHPNWLNSKNTQTNTHIFEFNTPFIELENIINTSSSPIVFIANYFFDSLPFRAFHETNNTWNEIYIKNLPQKKLVNNTETLQIPVSFETIDPYTASWLKKTSGTTTIPSLTQSFLQWCHQQERPIIIIGSDFTASNTKELTPQDLFSDNGCLSASLNFKALANITHSLNQTTYHEYQSTPSLKSFIITMHVSPPSNLDLKIFSNVDIKKIIQPLKNHKIDFEKVIEIIQQTNHDPCVISELFKPILENNRPPPELSLHINECASKVYPMPENNDWLKASHILCKLNKPDLSIKLCLKHLKFFGEDTIALRELGYALCLQGNRDQGLNQLKKALQKNPQCKHTIKLFNYFSKDTK